ncbi:MAG TPA: hypothetical protein VNA12_07640 [Mycobacteriales bacterium]|nr:hypothetical protein [Mycobacteriales bacterium]
MADHVSKVARLHCVPCDATVVVRLDANGFVDAVGDFAAKHRDCDPAREIALRVG